MKWISFFLVLFAVIFQGGTAVMGQGIPHRPDTAYHDTDLQVGTGKNLLVAGTPLTSYGLKQGFTLKWPRDMAIEPDAKSLFLIDRETDHIVKLDSSGRPVWAFRSYGQGPGEFTWPTSIKVRNGRLYIFDRKQDKICLYSLKGKFIQEIIPQRVASFDDFEVTAGGQIIIPNVYPQNYGGALFLLLNKKGEKIGQFGDNGIVQDDLKGSGNVPETGLNLSPDGRLVLSFHITGGVFVYDFPKRHLLNSFSVRNGPEWDAAAAYTKKSIGLPLWVHDVCITSTGEILIAFGGPFKDNVTVGMRFSAKGAFLGRIFANKQLQNVPSQMILENDSTVWVQDPAGPQFFRTHLHPFHKGRIKKEQ